MAQSHTWFATATDAMLIVRWLREAGAVGLDGNLPHGDFAADGREFILRFAADAPVEYWPEDVRLAGYPEGSARWRRAVIAKALKKDDPEAHLIDVDRSAVAKLRLPELRDGQHWVSGHLSFPGSKLRDTFPELARVCRRFERWLRRFPTAYDFTKADDQTGFGYRLCMSGAVERVVALPEAYAMLERGAFMVDHRISPDGYSNFRRRLQLAGYLP